MTTLAEFVAARLAEYETSPAPGRRALDDLRFELKRGDPYEQHLSSRIEDGLDAQTAAWQERALREAASLRKILAAYKAIAIGFTHVTENAYEFARREALEMACEAIAAIWSDHPDYDPAWRPE